MAIELRQQLKLAQQLIMTPQLQLAIRLLQLSRLELMDTIREELETNPALEESQDITDDDHPAEPVEIEAAPIGLESPPEKEVTIEEKISDDVDWSNYLEEYNSTGKVSFEGEDKDAPRFEAFVAQKESLSDHLLWQLMMSVADPEAQQIGSLIIGNLNKDGYLEVSVEDICQTGGALPEKVEEVLSLVQTFDPIGVCARDLGESLLIQARHVGADAPMVVDIIRNHLHHLENKNYKAIAKALKAEFEDIIAAVNVIRGLEPRPGQRFSNEEPHYIQPDIYVYKIENEFVIVLNDDGMPRLRLNNFYQDSLNGKLNDKAKEYMQERIKSASWLIKSIHQRQKTIYKVMESILKFQHQFFEKGIAYLKPMILRDVAEDVEMHESTISRVTTNKYAYTPQGIFELKYFFNSSINRNDGDDALASVSVQDRIRQLIESEDHKNPYSDDKLAQMLKESGIDIARRTVAKYREMLKILPSNKRKQF